MIPFGRALSALQDGGLNACARRSDVHEENLVKTGARRLRDSGRSDEIASGWGAMGVKAQWGLDAANLWMPGNCPCSRTGCG